MDSTVTQRVCFYLGFSSVIGDKAGLACAQVCVRVCETHGQPCDIKASATLQLCCDLRK